MDTLITRDGKRTKIERKIPTNVLHYGWAVMPMKNSIADFIKIYGNKEDALKGAHDQADIVAVSFIIHEGDE